MTPSTCFNPRSREGSDDHAGYINGEVIAIDGGEWLKGAGQFNFLDRLTPEEWETMRAKKSE